MRVYILWVSCLLVTVLQGTAAKLPEHMERQMEQKEKTMSPARIKEWIGRMKEVLEKDTEHFPVLIQELEKEGDTVIDPATQAVLHSMLAELYRSYYVQNSWQINQRTPIAGFVPEDIREWPANLFTDTIKKHIEASLQPAEVLQQTPARQFREIMEEGKDSPALRPTLFDFLIGRALDIQPTEDLYQQLISFRETQPEKEALMLAELAWLQYRYQGSEAYGVHLDELLKMYASYPFSVEIVAARLDQMNLYRYYVAKEDSVLALAYQLATETIRTYPDYPRIGLIRSKLEQIENPNFQLELPASVVPDKEFRVVLQYVNIAQVEMDIYQSALSPKDIFAGTYRTQQEPAGRGKRVWTSRVPLVVNQSYQKEKKEITFPSLATGLYEVVVRVPGEAMEIRKIINVTSVTVTYRTRANGPTDVFVTELESGKPLAGVTVRYYEGKRNSIEIAGEVKTGPEGIAQLPARKEITGFDMVVPGNTSFITGVYTPYFTPPGSENPTRVTVITDRDLYRPGQTIFFKGIAFTQQNQEASVVAGYTCPVSLYDANNQVVATRTLTTNDFGSLNGEFTLPAQGLPGTYTIRVEGISTYIQVEEYKRPSFQITLLPVTGEVAYGDVVTVSGDVKTYSGVPVYEGRVTYRVVKSDLLLRYYGNERNEQVAAGSTELQPDGSFRIEVSTGETNGKGKDRGYYQYQVYVMVTDSKGETQEETGRFAVGRKSFVLSAEGLKDKMNKAGVSVKVIANTLSGEFVTTEGTFMVYPLIQAEEETFIEGKVITSGRFRTGELLPPALFSRLPSGRYRIRFEAKDSQGEPVEMENTFVLYGREDKKPPVDTPLWKVAEDTAYLTGETAEIQIGSSFAGTYILYEILNGVEVVSREIIRLTNEIRTLRIPFLAAYGDGVLVSFTLIKDGELYRENVSLFRKYPDRTLAFRPQVFRDRLRPGQTENWTFRITGADSVAVHAEVLAWMYDLSLDHIYSSGRTFNLPIRPAVSQFWFEKGEGLQKSMESAYKPLRNETIPELSFDRIGWQGVLDSFRLLRQGYSGGVRMKSAAARSVGVMEENAVADTNSPVAPEPSAGGQPQIRTNFNETAFFFPVLRTDKEGDVQVSFTIPESNTTWKMQLFAHTADMKYGLYTNQVITQKPVMVLPNLPRFVRKGDVVSFSTQVTNLTGGELTGLVTLDLFDPVSGHTLQNQPANAGQHFLLAMDETGSYRWEWTVPYTDELIGVRIVATSAQGGDGEQHILPVVTDDVLITESQPFYLTGEGTRTVDVKPGILIPGARPYSLTFEMTTNPVWYAVQALPGLVNPESENVVDWFNAYYSNVVARSLLLTTPRLEQILRVWKELGGTAETLYSQLQKNEDLKQILLNETPWVMEAKEEAEQKQRLDLLFDVNRAASQKEIALQKLRDQQLESGAWGWFKGNHPDRQMTLYIMQGMAQLVQLNAIEYNQEEREMQIRALQYLDKAILENYQQLQKSARDLKNYVPSSQQVAYLFMRSSYRDIPEGDAREAVRYFTAQAEKNRQKLSLKEKAAVAILMQRNGNWKVAGEMADWFRKTATVSPEAGMYWANNRRGADYFGSPEETHVMIMDMFEEVSPVQEEADRMKQWLLLRKRTQRWTTTPATVHAVYILLKSGSDWLEEGNTLAVKWGDTPLSSGEGDAVTGYLKETVSGEKVKSGFEQAEIHKEGKTPAWGALYSQYFIPLDQVTADKGELSIDKMLFVETHSGEQRQIIPVTPERPLRVGDKVVVRLTVRSTQEMNYVYLNDLRPGCIEPSGQLSGLQYRDGIFVYRSPKDLSENFYMERLPAGTFVLEYEGYVSRTGNYSGGLSTIQCLYAPEFISHTQGNRIIVQP
ncbi:MAG: alpha-2-macroglobulin [Tannerellaceae bacterium]|nr:alpha-2-macroglobulin [Tannerellaceae bacterium]